MSEDKLKEFFGLNDEETNEAKMQAEKPEVEALKDEVIDDAAQDDGHSEVENKDTQDEVETSGAENEFDTSSLSKVELEAYEMGWRPKDHFDGDPDDFISAREYVRYGKLQNALKESKQELDAVKSDVQKQIERAKAMADKEYQARIEELEQQKKQAVYDADIEAYNKADQQQKELKNNEYQQPVMSKPQLIQEWEAKNEWVNNPNDERAIEASSLYATYVNNIAPVKYKEHVDANVIISDALKYVEDKMGLNKQEAVVNPMRKSAPVTSVKKPVEATKKLTINDLTREERNFWESIKNSSHFKYSLDEYLNEIANERGMK